MKTREHLKQLQNKTVTELAGELEDLRHKLFEAKMEAALGKLKNVRFPAKVRQQIAQVKTLLAIKEKTNA